MNELTLRSAWGHARTWTQSRLTRKGPRAYADTHDVAVSLLGGAPPSRVLDLGAGRGERSATRAARGPARTAGAR
ncbi:MAG: hypothetical protein NVSMB47_06280 [Polyangiales bacterium]